MEVLFLLIGISLIIAILFLVAFLVASKSGQFEDDYTPSIRMLFPENDESNEPLTNGDTSACKSGQ